MATTTIKKETEWVKKTGDTMTGNLYFAYANMLAYGEQATRRWILYPSEDLSSFYLATQEFVNGKWDNWKGVMTAHPDGNIEINQPLKVIQGGTGSRDAAGARINIGNGCPSTTFTTADGKTVTVTNGFITNVTG